jgi:hypothetical protein
LNVNVRGVFFDFQESHVGLLEVVEVVCFGLGFLVLGFVVHLVDLLSLGGHVLGDEHLDGFGVVAVGLRGSLVDFFDDLSVFIISECARLCLFVVEQERVDGLHSHKFGQGVVFVVQDGTVFEVVDGVYFV